GACAGLAVRLLAAASVLAGVARDAVGVAGAAADAGAVGAAVGRAVLHPGRQTASDTVAGAGGVEAVAAARRRRAHGLGGEGRADGRRARFASTLAVADVDVADRGAVAGARLADGSRRELATTALAVAGAVEATGLHPGRRAGVRLFGHAAGDERADAGRAL